MTLEDYLYVIDKYDGEIYYTDHFLGRLFEGVKDLGLYENSIIILTSDHGEHFFEHPHAPAGYVGHFELYDEIVKVPLIIKDSQLPEGRIVDQQVESIDIMPTVLELLGISLAHEIDGENLIQIVEEDFHDDDKRYSFSERYFSSPDEYDGYSEYKMIRKNDWKLLLRSAQSSGALKIELYNLQSDPREKSNLVAEGKEMGKYLFAKLQAWTDIQSRKLYLHPGEEVKLNEELVEQLKALGYIN
jgi:arylsulfatase A-like enzyme